MTVFATDLRWGFVLLLTWGVSGCLTCLQMSHEGSPGLAHTQVYLFT